MHDCKYILHNHKELFFRTAAIHLPGAPESKEAFFRFTPALRCEATVVTGRAMCRACSIQPNDGGSYDGADVWMEGQLGAEWWKAGLGVRGFRRPEGEGRT